MVARPSGAHVAGNLDWLDVEFQSEDVPAVPPPPRRGRALLLAAAAAVVGAAALVGVTTERRSPSPVVGPAPSTSLEPAPLGPPTFDGHLAALLGDSLRVGRLGDPAGSQLVGTVHPAPGSSQLGVLGRWVVVLGSSGTPARSGAWLLDATGIEADRYLGPAEFAAPVGDGFGVWIVHAGEAVEKAPDGTVLAGPAPVDGTPVAAAAAGLLLQHGDQVRSWFPSKPPAEVFLGFGKAHDAARTIAVWTDAAGRLTVSDPNTGAIRALPAVPVSPESIVRVSPEGDRIAILSNGRVRLVGVLRRYLITLPMADATSITWADDDLVLAGHHNGSVSVVDAESGTSSLAGRLPATPSSLAPIDPLEWERPVVADQGAWQVRAVLTAPRNGPMAVTFLSMTDDRTVPVGDGRPIAAARLDDGTVAGVVNDASIASLRVVGMTRPPPLTAPGRPFAVRVFALRASGPDPVTVEGLDASGDVRSSVRL